MKLGFTNKLIAVEIRVTYIFGLHTKTRLVDCLQILIGECSFVAHGGRPLTANVLDKFTCLIKMIGPLHYVNSTVYPIGVIYLCNFYLEMVGLVPFSKLGSFNCMDDGFI